MATTQSSSQHLTTARQLLDDVSEASDPQTKAAAATAHAILVLAEQVAAARVIMAAEAVTGGQGAAH